MTDTRKGFSPENSANIDIEIAQLKSDKNALHARLNAIMLPEKIDELDANINLLMEQIDESPAAVGQLQEQMTALVHERNILSLMLTEAVKLTKFNHLSNRKELERLVNETEERIQALQKSDTRKGKEEDSQDEDIVEIVDDVEQIIDIPMLLSVDKKYLKLRDAFMNKLDALPDNAAPELKGFYQRGRELHKAIVAQEKKQNFNAKVYGEIFDSAAAMLSAPGDENVHKQLSDSSQQKVRGKFVVDGHRSIPKNILYAVGAFLAAAAAVTLGLAFSMLLPVISIPAAIPLFAVGAAFAAGAVLVCVSGRKKGTANAIDNFAYAASKVSKSGIFAAQPNIAPTRSTEDLTDILMKPIK